MNFAMVYMVVLIQTYGPHGHPVSRPFLDNIATREACMQVADQVNSNHTFGVVAVCVPRSN